MFNENIFKLQLVTSYYYNRIWNIIYINIAFIVDLLQFSYIWLY